VIEKRNARFESYYKVSQTYKQRCCRVLIVHLLQEQGIVSDSEWEDLLNAFRASLPVTFRLAGSRA
jgi:hypothetical protein